MALPNGDKKTKPAKQQGGSEVHFLHVLFYNDSAASKEAIKFLEEHNIRCILEGPVSPGSNEWDQGDLPCLIADGSQWKGYDAIKRYVAGLPWLINLRKMEQEERKLRDQRDKNPQLESI